MLSRRQLAKLRSGAGQPNRLRQAMSLAGATQVQVAAAVGITQPQVSELVNGKYKSVTVETAAKLAGYFGCAIEDLFPVLEAVA